MSGCSLGLIPREGILTPLKTSLRVKTLFLSDELPALKQRSEMITTKEFELVVENQFKRII